MTAAETAVLIDAYRASGDENLRNQILEAHLHVADRIVPRFCTRPAGGSGGSVSAEDLRQTAHMALIGAIERFDPHAGATLATFATRTIEGELKRYLRDRTWLVRPPRRLQENHLNIRRATDELQHELGRAPSVGELSERIGISNKDVREGLLASLARSNDSLDRDVRGEDESAPSALGELIGGVDPNFALHDDLECLRAALRRLDDRERTFLRMRFVDEMSQSAIAATTGVSQSYVSRVLQHSIGSLRSYFNASAAA